VKTRVAIIAALVVTWVENPCARADVLDGLDTSIGSGGVVGQLAATQTDGTVRQFRFGGIPFAAFLNRDMAERWTGSLQLQALLDVINQQMLRQGFAGTISYHLLGGARQIRAPGEFVNAISTSRYNLSIAVRGGLFNYAAADRKNPSERLSGAVWEMAAGVEYRRTVSERSALGASLMATVITLPASVERIASRSAELLGFWRVYL
jgi:hypothetical protein